MTGLHPVTPCNRVIPNPSKTVTLVSTTDLSYQRARACPPEDAPA